VQLELPADAGSMALSLVASEEHGNAVLYGDGWPLKVYPLGASGGEAQGGIGLPLRPGDVSELSPLLGPDAVRTLPPGSAPRPGDADRDGIPDPLDLILGGHKTVLNSAIYDGAYVSIPYPGGDVPREQGVCTDVVVRALRNAGSDLQRDVHEDIARRPKAYPMVKSADDNIDHRRVKTILPYFKRHWDALAGDPRDAEDPYRAGDVIFMDTISSRSGPDHIGVISQRKGESGLPLVINNWDVGSTPDYLDLLDWVPVTHRFRIPASIPPRPVPESATHLIVVVGEGWNDSRASLSRFTRGPDGWVASGSPHPVQLGARGLAWGRGLHGDGSPGKKRGPVKQEGDQRSPAGVFALGDAYGVAAHLPTALPYTQSGQQLRCVDDPSSRFYGQIVRSDQVDADWSSSEAMARSDGLYRAVVVVEHNRNPVHPGGGSCIFLHDWSGPNNPVLGCTAMAGARLDELVAWAKPGRSVLVSLPRSSYDELRRQWRLPPR
jgi:D-alanyl-D-alanine dipeptidase